MSFRRNRTTKDLSGGPVESAWVVQFLEGVRVAERIESLARRVADGRRVTLGLHEDPVLGIRVALDSMMIPYELASDVNMVYARTVAETHAWGLRRSELFLADPDMCMLVDTAAPTMPDQVLREDDPLSPHGFLMFATPIADRTGTGLTVPIHAFAWSVIPIGHALLGRDTSGNDLPSVLLTAYVATADMAAAMGQRLIPNAPRYMPNSTVMWKVGTKIGQVYGDKPPIEGANPGFYQRAVAALWTLAKQPLAETTTSAPPTNKEKHRYRRAGIVDPSAPVRVVSLRHRPGAASSSGTGESGRHVSVRFMVRGHWKNAWRPSVQDHRLVFVAPHIKGPENAPLLTGEKVFHARPAPPVPQD
jgi:hypothetical protein